MKQLIICYLREKYRNYRASLKRLYFDKYSTNEERLMHIPPDVVKEDWVWLVNWFSSDEFKVYIYFGFCPLHIIFVMLVLNID